MKNLLFTCIFIVFTFFYNSISYSQGLGPNITSPQVYDFIRYGNIPVSHYTGSLNLSVPIYHYSDSDFDVNVNLRYSSSGFKPGKRPNIVGLDWFLNAGGAITRTVKGLPDEVKNFISNEPNDQSNYSGFKYLAEQNLFWNNHMYFRGRNIDTIIQKVTNIINYNYSIISHSQQLQIEYGNKRYELQPDIFNFNFMGYTGKFFYGFDGKIHVVADGNFKVDMSGFSTQYLFQDSTEEDLDDSIIKITDARGYEYTFGGEKKYLEYTMGLGIMSSNQDNAYRPIITTWNLKKVKAPNGRKIIYDYLDYPILQNDDGSGDTQLKIDDWPQYLFYARDHYYVKYGYYSENNNFAFQESITGRGFKVIKTSYLHKITIDNDVTITFNYKPNTTTFYDSNDFPARFNRKNLRLNYIDINYKYKNVKRFFFTYQDIGPRFFLTEIKEEGNNPDIEEGKNPYIFEYSQTNNLPKPIIKNIDYWGFWNGGYDASEGGVLIPNYIFINGGDLEYTSPEREPNSFSNRAMLTKVIYPTKGFSEIEYELHTYSKRLENKSDNEFFPQLYDVNNLTAGGVRVKKITDHDSSGNSYSREFKYVKNAMTSTNNISSGVLNYWPRYIRKYHTLYYVPAWDSSVEYDITETSADNIGYINFNDNYITYSEVAEVFSDGSSKIYKFNTYETNPDVSLVSYSDLSPIIFFPQNLSAIMSSLELDETSIERGKIKSIDLYTDNHTRVQNTTYHYNEDTSRFCHYIGTYLKVNDIPIYYYNRIFTYQNNLEKKIVTTYDINGLNPIVTEEEYQYDLNTNLLKRKKSINSKNQEYSTYYKYPTDYNLGQGYMPGFTAILKSMLDKNMLYPIEIKSTLKDISEKVTSSSLFEYKNELGNIVKFKEFKLKGLQDTFQDSFIQYIYKLEDPDNPVLVFTKMDKYYENIIYHHYDQYGNPTEVSKADGTHIYYIYGYHHSKPIVKIVNFTQEQAQNIQSLIDSAVSSSNRDIDASREDALRVALDSLRQALPDNTQITTYTYDPLIGVTSITDPKGDTQYYIYDSFNRLKYIKDKDGHILKEYEYHYRE